MRTLRLGFADTYENAKRFFTETLGKRFLVIRDDDNPDYLIFGDSNFGESHYKYNHRKVKKIFFTGENVRPNYFTYNHAITFDHENSARHYRLPLWVPEMKMMTYEGWTDDYLYLVNRKIDAEYEWQIKTEFCSFVQSNPRNIQRNTFFEALNRVKKVNSAGPHLNNMGFVLPRDGMHHKLDFLRKHKFNIAFENGAYRGYCTEKILNAYYANTVPIYWGSTTVHRDFNPKSYIYIGPELNFRRAIEQIMDLTDNKNAYLDMLTSSPFRDNIAPSVTDLDQFLDWFDTFVYEEKNGR